MRITQQAQARACAICERTLLLGERATRFSPDGRGQYVDVCPLCVDFALEHGWFKEGSPTTPTVAAGRRGRRGLPAGVQRLGRGPDEPVVSEPILRCLSESELAIV